MTIAEVSRRYDLSQDTLRYYERIGLLPGVGRDKSGNRNYLEQDLKWVEFIKCMRGAGLSIEVLTEYVSLFQQGDSTLETRRELLKEQRRLLAERIGEMQCILDRLDLKIDRYEQTVAKKEKELMKVDVLQLI